MYNFLIFQLKNPIYMNEGQFMQWFMTEPPVLEWLQILYRIKMAENGKGIQI